MSNKTEIWAVLREVYGFWSDTPTTDQQIEVVDKLDKYMKGTYKPEIRVSQTTIEEVIVSEKKVVMVTQPDGTQKPRGRGRPRKG